MTRIDELIEALKKTKEDLEKNVNGSYSGSTPNMAAGAPAMKSELAPGKVKVTTRVGPSNRNVKDVGDGRMVIGDSPSPGQVESKLKSMASKSDDDQPPARDADKKQVPLNIQKAESCSIAKNGQWSLKKDAVNPKWAPKEAKIKELQNKIDLGQYKPQASKIADAMVKHPEKPLAKSEKKDYTKMPVSHVASAKAISGHGYEITHHFPDGSSKPAGMKAIKDTDIRKRNPAHTHAIHFKGMSEPIHTDEATAMKALKDGHFNLEAHTEKAGKKQ